MKPLDEPARYKRQDALVWRPEIPAEDSAPAVPAVELVQPQWKITDQAEAREMLRRQMCPVCGEGPWKSPLNHAAKKHGIDKRTLREACGMTSVESVADPELSARIAERMRDEFDPSITVRGKRGSYRTTAAGRAAAAANFRAVSDEVRRANAARSKTPEAQAKRSATIRAKHAKP